MSDDPARWWDAELLDRETWGDLVAPALERLMSARDRDRLPHAVLLVGPAGLGRELAALRVSCVSRRRRCGPRTDVLSESVKECTRM